MRDTKRIEYEDDLVVVYQDGKKIYQGIEDYEPMKYENWKWDNTESCYILTIDSIKYKKYCLEI